MIERINRNSGNLCQQLVSNVTDLSSIFIILNKMNAARTYGLLALFCEQMRESDGLNVRHRYETAITQFNSQQEITNQKNGILAKTSMKKEMDYLFEAYGYRLGGFLNDDPGCKTISARI